MLNLKPISNSCQYYFVNFKGLKWQMLYRSDGTYFLDLDFGIPHTLEHMAYACPSYLRHASEQ